MMHTNRKGFTVVESLVVVAILSLLVLAGWYSLHLHHTSHSPAPAAASDSKASHYTFTELGIGMDILPGWSVKRDVTRQNDFNVYTWTVQNPHADGKIELSSSGFAGGFEGCDSGSLLRAQVLEIAPTHFKNLVFLSWVSDLSDNSQSHFGQYHTVIAGSDEAFFRTSSTSETALSNSELKPGAYYFCESNPYPGFLLHLNNEAAGSYSRRDAITALTSDNPAAATASDGGTSAAAKPLPPTADSYSAIKTMLTSIR